MFFTVLALIGLGLLFRYCNFMSGFTASVVVKYICMLVSLIVVFISVSIVLCLLGPAIELFNRVPVTGFLGVRWNPYGSDQSLGILPLITGTLLVTVISVVIAMPVAIFSALFVTQFLSKFSRGVLKYIFEIPASIPSVVYGYFGVFKIAPVVFKVAHFFHLNVNYENALTAGIAISIMIAPIIFYMTCDLIESVPKAWQYAVLSMGATRTELVFSVILPHISPGVVSAMFLAVARVIGETMIVVLVVGLRANLTVNPLQEVTTMTTQIVSLLNGDADAGSVPALVAYALGLALFIITLVLSMGAMYLDNKNRKRYKLFYS